MADVFISYSHKNTQQATRVSEQLQGGGLSLWWDKHLRPGDDFSMTIEHELDAAGAVVVLWSDAARRSLWVRAEANDALDDNKLVQARLDGVRPPLPFRVLQTLDLQQWRGSAGEQPFPQMLSALGALKSGAKPSLDQRVYSGPALQDFGSAATPGWLALLLVFATAGLTILMGSRQISPDTYKTLTAAAFGASFTTLFMTLARLIGTIIATGRK